MNLLDFKSCNIFSLPFRVAIVAALFMSLPATYAEDSRLTWPEIREQAEQHILNKERSEALDLVHDFLKENQSETRKAEAEEFISYVSNLFLTEKAHKTYFLGRSLVFSEPERAKEKLLDALKIEPTNEKIILELTRVFLRADDCKNANQYSLKAHTQNPVGQAAQFLYIQSLYCLQDWKRFTVLYEKLIENSEISPLNRLSLTIMNFQSDFLKEGADEKISQLLVIDPKFPLAHYWQLQLLKKDTEEFKKPAQKYLSICKMYKAKVVKRYENYPRMCNFVPEVSKSLQ